MKQETIEEAVNTFKKTDVYINEIKQKQERMYTEEDLEVAYFEGKEGLYSFNDFLKQLITL